MLNMWCANYSVCTCERATRGENNKELYLNTRLNLRKLVHNGKNGFH